MQKNTPFTPEVLAVAPLSPTAIEIRSRVLDPITVFWVDYEPGRGMVTLVCWGCAWNCYFGGMGGRGIREFFEQADTGYLVNKLGITQFLKQSKQHEKYLSQIIDTVKAALSKPYEVSDAR